MFMRILNFIACVATVIFAQDSLLVWQDEFNYTGVPDPAKWGFERGYVRNNEAQYYTDRPENVRVENGSLVIEARADGWNGHTFTSAALSSQHKASWTYGRIDVRARFSTIRGTWPAIWMLSENTPYGTWPASGEIDIMENVGYDPNTVHGTIHSAAYNHMDGLPPGAPQVSNNIQIPNLHMSWNVYSVVWTPDSILMEANGITYMRSGRHGTWREWPFNHDFYLILNVAIGGSWGGQRGIDTLAFPARMEVDFVRVYKRGHGPGPYTVQTIINPAAQSPGTVLLTPNRQNYTPLSTLVMEARANAGWEFYCWSNGSCKNPDTVFVDHNMQLVANFLPRGERIFESSFTVLSYRWAYWFDDPVQGSLHFNNNDACVTVGVAGYDWQAQINYPGLSFQTGEIYDLRLRARASVNNRPITVGLRQNISPYNTLAANHELILSTTMQEFTHQFIVQTTETEGRFELDFGQHASQVCVTDISLRLVDQSTSLSKPMVKPAPSPNSLGQIWWRDLLGRVR